MRRTPDPWRRKLFGLVAVLLVTIYPTSSWAADGRRGDTHSQGVTSEFRYGPITLPPAVGDEPGRFAALVPYTPALCSDCYLTGARVDLVYQDGSSANLDTGVMLHHLVVFNSGRPDATCAPDTAVGSLGERFFATGNERTGGALPSGFGYHLGTDPVRTAVDLMNHSPEPKVVLIKATISHVPDSTPGMAPVTPVWLDENNCGNSEYAVPAGPSHQVWRWTSTITGRVVTAGGHVHDGGIKTVLSNETTGQHLCTSYAGYGRNPAYMGSLESMTTCIHDRLGTVRAGEVLALDTYYDVRQARNDVMGIMIAYVYETDDLGGGAPPPAESAPPPVQSAPPPSHPH